MLVLWLVMICKSKHNGVQMGTKKAKVVGVRLDDVGQYWLENLAHKLYLSEAEVMRQALQCYAEKYDLRTERQSIIKFIRENGRLSESGEYTPGK